MHPEPWAFGMRLREEPEGDDQFTVPTGSPADGRMIAELHDLPDEIWISFVVRDHQLLTVRPGTRLRAGDEVLVVGHPDDHTALTRMFGAPARRCPDGPTGLPHIG